MIYLNEVTKRYADGQVALDNVTFTANAGDMLFLTGHSGAGKTTLLRLLWAEEICTTGEVVVNQFKLNTLKRRSVPNLRRSLGIVLQAPDLLEERSVFDNVALPLIVADLSPKDIKRRVNAALDKVGLTKQAKKCPMHLSLGERQRVGLARAVVNKPAILLADEPTGNLDPELSKQMLALFTEFNRVGVTVLIATHDLGLIATLPHRVLVLKQGKLLGQGELA